MNRIVYTESNCQYNINAGDNVNSNVPKVKETNDVGESYEDNGKNHETDRNIGQEYQCNDENADHGKSNVPP